MDTLRFREIKDVGNNTISVGWHAIDHVYGIKICETKNWERVDGMGAEFTFLDKKKVAKQVFDYAVDLAKTEKNVTKLHQQVEQYARSLPQEVEE